MIFCCSIFAVGLEGCASVKYTNADRSDSAWIAVNSKVDSLLTEEEYAVLRSHIESEGRQGNPWYLLVGGILMGAVVAGLLYRAH